MRPVRIIPEPCRSVFGPGFGSGAVGGGTVTITNQITEITASGLSEDPGQVLTEGTDGGALLLGDDIRAALDAVLGGPEWRAAEAERVLSYDAATRALGILGGTGVTLPLATTAEPGLMSAADKQALIAASGGVGGPATELTRAGIAVTAIEPGVASLRTSGFASPGDGGGGLYARAAAEPAHAGKVQSADGAWWVLVPEGGRVSVLQFGAARSTDGSPPATDAHAAFAAALGYAALWSAGGQGAGLAVEVPQGRYLIGQTLEIRAALVLRGQPGAAGAGAAPVELVFPDTAGIVVHDARTLASGAVETPDDPATPGARGAVLEGLALTGAGAGAGFDAAKPGIRVHARCTLRALSVAGFSGHGVHIEADPAAGADATGWTALDIAATRNGGSGFFVAGEAHGGRAFGLALAENGRWGLEDRAAPGSAYAGVAVRGNGTAAAGQDGATALVERGGDVWCAAVGAGEAALTATEPGTDDAVWRLAHPGGGGLAPALAPAWAPGQPAGTYVVGGAALVAGSGNGSAIWGLSVEPDQGLVALDAAAIAGGRTGRIAPGGGGTGLALAGNGVAGGASLRFDPEAGGAVGFSLRDGPDGVLSVATGGTPEGVRLGYETGLAGGALAWRIGSDGARAQVLTLGETTAGFGRPAPVGGGRSWFPGGVFLGAEAEARQVVCGPDALPGENHGAGDLVLASAPAQGAPAGWLWLSAHEAGGAAGTARALWQVPSLDGAVTLPAYDAAALAGAGAAGHAGTLVWESGRGAPAVSDGVAWRDLRALPVLERPGDATLTAGEAFAVLRMTSAVANTVTVGAGALAVGEHVTILQSGEGQTAVVPGPGVTIESETTLALRARHAVASLICVAPDTHVLVGALAEA